MRLPWRLFRALAWWQQGLVALAAPLVALNLTVAVVGQSVVFPLSPFFVREKLHALGRFARHLPGCVWNGHGELDALTSRAEADARLPKGLLKAVVAVESEGRAHRISFAGAMGPAQLMPGTCAQLGVDDPFDPHQALPAGARYLASLLKRFGSVELAVAAYNAGPGAVHGAVPDNGETRQYVAQVMLKLSPVQR